MSLLLPSMSGYETVKMLGKGSYGKVFLAINSNTRQRVAFKFIGKDPLSDSERNQILNEASNHRISKHPNIVNFINYFEDFNRIVFELEYACEGDLQSFIQRKKSIDETTSRRMFKQMVSGIQHLHEKNIVHLDIKPLNILLGESFIVKLADFGASERIAPGQLLSVYRTSLIFAAPEIVLRETYDGKKADIWSLGVVLYYMVTGKLPFMKLNDIVSVTYQSPGNTSDEFILFIQRLLQTASNRYSIHEIQSDSWFENGQEKA